MSGYAFIIAACKKYIPDINACLNSLDSVGNIEDVHLWYYKYPDWYLEKLRNLSFTYQLILHEITEPEAREYGGEGEILLRKRYWYAGEIGKNYSAICVLDADMVFVRNPIRFFEIADKTGFILGCTLEQCKIYNDEHDKAKGKFLIDPAFFNDKDICAVPLFVDARKHESWLKKSWDIFVNGWPVDNFKSNDMDAINICLLEAGYHDYIIKLPNVSWLGTNESLLKPYTRACARDKGILWNENGGEIFSIHGQFYKKNWRDNQLANRSRCAKGYLGCNEKSDEIAKEAMNAMHNYWNKMCYNHKVIIPKMNYINPEMPEE